MTGRITFSGRRLLVVVIAFVLVAGTLVAGAVRGAQPAGAALPIGFSDKVVLSGLKKPTNIEFAADGSVFIAEKSGRIWNYQGFADPSPRLVADLSTQVDDYWDRGLLGLAVPPGYPSDNHLYVLYARDAPLGGTAPTWNDACPTPPGPTTDGCTVSGRLSRLTLENGVSVGEQPLLDGWCQQFPSHSVGTLMFGPDGYLYVSGGEGASFTAVDYGQFGAAKGGQANVCGDPPGGAGTALTPPSAQGGSLRAQSVLRPAGPALLNGSVLRLDPATGGPAPGNPYFGNADVNKARIVAFGFRNPFRLTMRPGTNELWVGDVGQNSWEEIDRVADPTAPAPANYGWPCYEGPAVNAGFKAVGLTQCNNLYNAPGSTVAPYYTYQHTAAVNANDGCPTGGSSITGLSFYSGSGYPAQFRNALFFTDHTRECLWAMLPGANGNPNPATITSLGHVGDPVELTQGPAAYNGDLFYVSLDGGAVHRLSYSSGSSLPPVAVASVTPASGAAPLTVTFDGRGSSDPEGSALTYAWDFGDGQKSTAATGTHTYATAGTYTATLTVKDATGLTDSASVPILAGSQITSMKVAVTGPAGAPRAKFRVGDRLSFSATAVDAKGVPVPAANYSWHLSQHHCATPTNCHAHDAGTVNGVTKGVFTAPDHEYPSYLTVELAVTLPGTTNVLRKTVTLQPQTVTLTLKTNMAAKIPLTVDGTAKPTSFTVTMIRGHLATISAQKTVYLNGHKFTFVSWSDKGAATHTLVAPLDPITRTANYKKIY